MSEGIARQHMFMALVSDQLALTYRGQVVAGHPRFDWLPPDWLAEGVEEDRLGQARVCFFRGPRAYSINELQPVLCVGEFTTAGDRLGGRNRVLAPELYDALGEALYGAEAATKAPRRDL